jgi:F0F1-type ATP synthase membrane subunit b/b'
MSSRMSISSLSRRCRSGVAGCILIGALLGATAPALASDEHAEQGAAEEHEHQGGHGHGGRLHFRDLWNTESLGALINFGLLLAVLHRLGSKPLRQFLVSRRADMEREIAAAAEAKAKAEAKYQEYSQRMGQLDQELAKLRKDMESAAQEDKKRILAEADENSRRVRRETESLIDQYAKAVTASIRRDMVSGAVLQAEKLLRDAMTDADQQRLAQGYVSNIDHETAHPAPGAGRAPTRAVPQEQS